MKNSKMLFLTEKFTGKETIFAISEDEFEQVRMSETYDYFGQKNSPYDCGDWITLMTEKAVEVANKAYQEENETEDAVWNLQDDILAFDNSEEFDAVVEDDSLQEGVDYEHEGSEVKAYTFWSGSNWNTITIEQDVYEPTHIVITDEDLIQELNNALEKKEHYRSNVGGEVYRYGRWEIESSNWEGDWAAWEIEEILEGDE